MIIRYTIRLMSVTALLYLYTANLLAVGQNDETFSLSLTLEYAQKYMWRGVSFRSLSESEKDGILYRGVGGFCAGGDP